MELNTIQREVEEWVKRNFPNHRSHQPLLGAIEELGELCHAHLKREQGVRIDEDFDDQTIDALGDVLIYLLDYSNMRGISLQKALRKTWLKVKKRNWKKDPKKGGEK